ncbi:MAG TPA: hypothetical protein VFZ70_02010 [Euzebyales bacterium]
MPVVEWEVGVTQPQRDPSRTEVNDLRNIVDRLDLLMDATGQTTDGPAQPGPTAEVIAQLTERIDELTSQVDDLRTLVNHLMTIATWQARVTATLVDEQTRDEIDRQPDTDGGGRDAGDEAAGDGAGPEDGDVDGAADRASPPPSPPAPTAAPDTDETHVRIPRPPRPATRRAATALDDDIDDIHGGHRAARSRDAPPPDFGI